MKPGLQAALQNAEGKPADIVTGRIMTGNLGYYVRAEGSGPPVLLLHGFTGSHQSFDQLAQTLSRKYTVVRPDLPGHAQSVVGKEQVWSMDTVVFSLLRMMRELGFETFSLLGYSMGGRIALAMAEKAQHRLDCLVVESGSPGLENETERAARAKHDNELAERLEAMGLAPFIEEWSQQPLFETQRSLSLDVRERQKNIRLSHLASGLAASLRYMGTGVQSSVWDALPQLVVPTLLITGEQDDKFCGIARKMEALAQDAKHVVVPGAGHAVHLEQPTRYQETVQAFLDNYAKPLNESHSWVRTTMFAGEDDR